MMATETPHFETTDSAVSWAKNVLSNADISDARFEAQLLLALALGVSRVTIIAGTSPPPDAILRRRFINLVESRARHIPFAYLRGTQEFYGLTFAVSPAVLIPRPETELLVDFVLEKLREWNKELPASAEYATPARPTSSTDKQSCPPLIADVGSGSGCLPIAIVTNLPDVRAIAFDISHDALMVAERNAAANGVTDRIRFVRSDLLSAARDTRFALIVSNPPYIPTAQIDTLQPEVRGSEPRLALDGGTDGLDFYRRLVRQAHRTLLPGGWLAVEIGQEQGSDVSTLMASSRLKAIETRNDLAGIARVVCGRRSL